MLRMLPRLARRRFSTSPSVLLRNERMVVMTLPVTPFAMNQYLIGCRETGEAAIIDAGDNDPPAQFLHLDDLASAVCLASRGELS